MILYSNCKINIGLNIVRKRTDGFHDIESVFYPLNSLCDIVEVVKSDCVGVQYSESGIVVDCPIESNLCVKAAKLMQDEFQLGGVAIHLHKEIPFGAGLGGGSANATYVIIAINKIFELNLNDDTLLELSAKLGSDTAFFVKNVAQLAEGRGEELSPIDIDLSGKYIVLIKPNVAVSTGEAYAGTTPTVPEVALKTLVTRNISTWKGSVVNDFEKSVFAKHPELSNIKRKLYEKGAIYASMSGSGSSIYGIFNSKLELDLTENQAFVHQAIL